MKVLISSPTYLPSRRANTFQVVKMAQAIQDLGNEVCILVPDTNGWRYGSWNEFSEHYGVVNELDIQWLAVKPHLRGYDYGYQAIRFFRGWKGEILYTRLPQAAAWGSLMNVPTIFEVHDFPGGQMGPWLFKLFMSGRGARRLVVISQALRDALHHQVHLLPDSPFTLVAPDGVDLSRYEVVPSSLDARISLRGGPIPQLPVQNLTIGYTGHLYEGRGIQLILELAHHLPEFSFLLVGGDIADVVALKAKVDQRGLENVIMTGFVDNSKLPLYQAACDILVMPYQQKVAASSGGNIAPYLSPMKLFEYLACGRVILSSDLPVLREVLHERNSILLPPEDLGAWLTALREISEDLPRQRALGEYAREDSKQYTWTSRAEKIFSLSVLFST